MKKTLRQYRLEIVLSVAIVALVLQLGIPPFTAWLNGPHPGSIGLIHLEHIEGLYSLSNECLLYLPPAYDGLESFPLLLYLHGSGDRGNDLSLVEEHGLPRFLSDGGNYPTIVAAPQCRKDRYWQPDELLVLIDFLEDKFSIDPDRIYVLGESMGGSGAWNLAQHSPNRFAAVVPLCGYGYPQTAESIGDLPIWAFHGKHDNIVPLEESERMVNAVAKAGGQARLTILKERGHDLRDLAWKHKALVNWMMSQRREDHHNP
jgi:predicted peptidase